MSSAPRRSPMPVRLPTYGVSVFESEHARGFVAPPMRHRYLKVLLVLRGRGRLTVDDHVVRFESGDVVVVPIGQKHLLEDDPDAPPTLLAACGSASALGLDEPALTALPRGRLTPAAPVRHAIEAMIRSMLYEQAARRPAHPAMLRGLMGQLVATLARLSTPTRRDDPPALAAVRAFVADLEQRFFRAPALNDAAARVGLSRRRFTDLFRQVTGRSYVGHLRHLRIAHAQHLLRSTDHSVTAVAFACGFEDLSTFYRAFHRLSGCAPATFRASATWGGGGRASTPARGG